MWNLRTIKGRSRELAGTLVRTRVIIAYIQVKKWKEDEEKRPYIGMLSTEKSSGRNRVDVIKNETMKKKDCRCDKKMIEL